MTTKPIFLTLVIDATNHFDYKYPAAEREYLRMRWAVQQANNQLNIAGIRVELKKPRPFNVGAHPLIYIPL